MSACVRPEDDLRRRRRQEPQRGTLIQCRIEHPHNVKGAFLQYPGEAGDVGRQLRKTRPADAAVARVPQSR
jgi:hypothetical protein